MNIPRLLQLLGWNQRALTFSDFEAACEHQEIQIVRPKMKTPGMYFHCEGYPVIALSSRLSGVRLWYAGWHEMVHHLQHPPGLRCFTKGTVSKIESEANVLAVCSVLDEPTLYRIYQGELHDFPKDILAFRRKVLERFKI